MRSPPSASKDSNDSTEGTTSPSTRRVTVYQKRNDWEGYNLGNTDPNQRGLDRWRHRRRTDYTTIITIIVGLLLCLVTLGGAVYVAWLTTRS